VENITVEGIKSIVIETLSQNKGEIIVTLAKQLKKEGLN